jgi:phosphodiesterase/alkaline phosphatase D-like protein
MKKAIKINLLFIAAFSLLLTTGCKKHNVPVITTTAVTNVTASGATSGGNVTSDGNADVMAKGVCWSTGQSPTISDSHTSDGKGTGAFISTITGLNPGTTYHMRAYATNSEGTGYGNFISFASLGSTALTSTLDATSITTTAATLNGLVNPNYLSTTVTFEYGLTTTYGTSVAAAQSPITGSSSTSVSVNLTGLNSGATYHFRVKAVNSIGTTYGDDKAFTTRGQAPSATTLAATNVLTTSVTFNGQVNANELSTTVTFEYGLTTSYGSSVTATPGTVTGTTNTSVSANLTGINPGATYHFRVKAVNALGTTNGDDKTFTTSGQAPAVTTTAATHVLAVTATVNGTVNAGDLSTTVSFEYGLTTSYGSTAAATQSPVTGTTSTNVSADISNLTPGGITYHYRVKAVNVLGTVYGSDMTFVTTGQEPLTLTADATNVASTTATLNGIVIVYDVPTTVTFEYGLDTNYGSTVTAAQSPATGSDPVYLSADISGLTPGTLYYFRTKAQNTFGTYYGDYLTFTTGAK